MYYYFIYLFSFSNWCNQENTCSEQIIWSATVHFYAYSLKLLNIY